MPQVYLLQALCHHNAELVKSAAALRDLKLLVGSGGLDFPTSMNFWNMDSWQAKKKCQFFIASWLLLHGNMGPTSKDATTNRFGDHKPKNLIETSLWKAWVAWIERGQQILGTENLRRRIIRIHHGFTTQTSTLAMFELDCDSRLNNSPLPILWSLHELNVFAVALVLNKPCLCTLRAQSCIVKRIAHMHSVHLFGTLLDFLTW